VPVFIVVKEVDVGDAGMDFDPRKVSLVGEAVVTPSVNMTPLALALAVNPKAGVSEVEDEGGQRDTVRRIFSNLISL
jgi:hypothetical protein